VPDSAVFNGDPLVETVASRINVSKPAIAVHPVCLFCCFQHFLAIILEFRVSQCEYRKLMLLKIEAVVNNFFQKEKNRSANRNV